MALPCDGLQPRGDDVEKIPSDVEAALRIEFANAGGAGHIYLREVGADYVHAYEAQASADQFRPHGLSNFPISIR